ncbi:meiosis-specific protein MEI4 isoform X2 [Dicentrarchus labrax]|uniref:meiosis-specific protein MEI4 isoform X2 n=1 Tax=Dicentrarchus labrax TaxID=13489 RepID=UPI0021F543C2|nr:meiosis-specific protein MEI4 isoform X2 [Dicentrarchus labrax]
MEGQQGHLKGVTQAERFFLRAKVAQAVGVIKSKPSGLSGREYAEVLATKLKIQDEGWKKKAQELQQEVLRLRQELLVATATSITKSSTAAAGQDNTMDTNSQDLFGPESVAYSTDLQPDCDSETPELLLPDPEPAVPSPQLHLPSSPHRKALLPHVQFLQSLCALHRVEESSRGLESLWFRPDGGAGLVLVDSVCQLLDSVVAACREPPLLGPTDLVLQACQVAARAMDLFCSQRLPSVEFMRRVEKSLRELTGMLLHCNQLSGVRESFGLIKFPMDQYQNSCCLFWILEELLQKSKVPCRVEVGSEQAGFLSHLERRIFLLSNEFPMFSISMWRIGGLLTVSDR